MPKLRSRIAVLATLVSTSFAGAAAANPIDEICLKGGRSEARCVCATDALAATLAEVDLALYSEASDAYLLRSAAGLPDEDAWAAAIMETSALSGRGEADVRSRVQLAGALHRDAIRSCR